MFSKKFLIGALVVGGALASGLAQARDDIQWSVTIGTPIGVPFAVSAYSQPYPVYSQPVPVYVRPAPVVVRQPYPYWRGHGVVTPTRWDRDGDGIPNRYDRVYNPRWDRDGDGIPNRYDRHPGTRVGHNNDRDHDGIPNWQDRNDNRGGRR